MKKEDQEELSEGALDEEEQDEQKKPKRFKVQCIIGDQSPETLRNLHPQRSTFEFNLGKSESLVTITSNFDAGNMARCEQSESKNHVSAAVSSQFNIWMSSDSMPYYKYTGFRTWFYFGIKGANRGQKVNFTIKNMNFQRSLYAAGLKPFYRTGTQGKFKRIPGKVTWNVSHYADKIERR